jgi:hypothetical protein
MKEEEGPTIDLLCIVKIIPAIISISPIMNRYFPIFFGRCTVFISLPKNKSLCNSRYGITYKNFAQMGMFNSITKSQIYNCYLLLNLYDLFLE